MNPVSTLLIPHPVPTGAHAAVKSASRRCPAGCRAIGLALTGTWMLGALPAQADDVRPVTPELRASAALDPFYKKYTLVGALPIVSSDKPSDFALLEAAYVIRNMLDGRDDILQAKAARGGKVAVATVRRSRCRRLPPDRSEGTRRAYSLGDPRGAGPDGDAGKLACIQARSPGWLRPE